MTGGELFLLDSTPNIESEMTSHAIQIGQIIAHYQIVDKLGDGGMGVVYRAEDTKLGRQVALKFLPQRFTEDPDWLARFEREAKVLASLNHQNIAAIYGLERSGSLRFLVLELVEGQTLAQRLESGALSTRESLQLCSQMARAIESAHRNGIVHRDLKPANVTITPEGQVKVLDFGLAKSVGAEKSPELSKSPTLRHDLTTAGMVLGTAAYMSPEQARGKEIDKRTDIWAAGCILYELLTGRGGFAGETVTDILGAIVMRDPDWDAIPADTPPSIRRLLRRCLRKDPDSRLHDIADFRIEIEDALAEPNEEIAVTRPDRPKRRLPWVLSAVATAIALVAVWFATTGRQPRFEPILRQVSINTERINIGGPGLLSLSPDGSRLAYVGGDDRQIYLRPFDQLESVPVAGTSDAWIPFFSPEGDSIGYWDGVGRRLMRISLSGGIPVQLCSVENPYGAVWGRDNYIYFSGEAGEGGGDPVMQRVSVSGGTPEVLATGEDESGQPGYFAWPRFLPRGGGLLVTRFPSSAASLAEGRIEFMSLEGKERKVILEGASAAFVAPSGHLVAVTGDGLVAVPFDRPGRQTIGTPIPLLQNLHVSQDIWTHYDLALDGTLVYVPGSSGQFENELLWVDSDGFTESVDDLMEGGRFFLSPRISPSGTRVALTQREKSQDNIWIFDLERSTLAPVTFEARNGSPVWSPNEDRVIFNSNRSGALNIFSKATDGSGGAERLTTSDNGQFPSSISPDGKFLAYSERNSETRLDLWVMALDGSEAPRLVHQSPFNESNAVFSPDGRWLAYESDQSRRFEVYVRPFPGPGSAVQVSTRGGQYPIWHPGGQRLYYMDDDRLMAVDLETDPELKPGLPELEFKEDIWNGYYDLDPANQRFIMVQREEEQFANQVNVLFNLFSRLRDFGGTR